MSEESPEPTEQEILASVFYHCDVDKKGWVTVSQILDFLRRTKPDWDFGELEVLLDPNGINPEVDLESYQIGISRWVQSVRSTSVDEDEGDSHTPDLSGRFLSADISYDGGRNSRLNPSARSGLLNSSGASSVLEGDTSDASRSLDLADALASLQESQLRVKHLLVDNEHLQQTVAASEEQNTALLSEVDELKKRITKQNALLSRNRKKLEDQYDLSQVEDQRRLQTTSDRVGQLEKEKAQLEMNLTRSEDERMQLAVQLERVQEEYHSTVDALASNPASLQQQLHVSMERSSHLESRVSDLSSANGLLQSDNRQLEAMLSDIRDQQSQSLNSYGSPLIHSTPMKREHSIHDELVASEKKAGRPNSPLPFSDIPASRSVPELANLNGMSDWRADVSGTDTERVGSFSVTGGSTARVGSVGSSEDLLTMLSQVRHHFHTKKMQALRHVSELSDAESVDEVVTEKTIDISMNNISSFESKLGKLVTSRKAAVDEAARLKKEIALLQAELDQVKTAKEVTEHRMVLSEEQATAALSSLEQVHAERDQCELEMRQCCDKLSNTERELCERTRQYDELQARFKAVPEQPSQSQPAKCEECGRILSPSGASGGAVSVRVPRDEIDGDSTRSSPLVLLDDVPLNSSFDDPPPTSTPTLAHASENENQAISALLKGLPSEYNLLRSEAGVVEKHYRNISEILQDLCESAEGCPETTRRAKEEMEVRIDWCRRQLESLSSPSSPLVANSSLTEQLVLQLKCAVQHARICGRSEQDFLYLSLIKVLVQYINLIRLEVFLPSYQRSQSIRVHEIQGRFSVALPQLNLPRSSISRWQGRPGSYGDSDLMLDDTSRDRLESPSRSSSRMSAGSTVATVFHESCLSYQHFGDVFPPQPPPAVDADADVSSERCSQMLSLISQQKKCASQAKSGRFFVVRSVVQILLLFVVLLIAVCACLAPRASQPQAHQFSDSFWHVLLPLERYGQYTLRDSPVT